MDLQPTVRIFSQSCPEYSLSIRNGKVVIALSNSNDPFQHWIKDDGYGGFTIFNKGTGQAIKRSSDVSPINEQIIQVLLISIPFGTKPDDPNALWIESKEMDGFITISGRDRPAFRLQPDSCLTFDGNTVHLTKMNHDSCYQRWKFVSHTVCPKTFMIQNKDKLIYNLTVRENTVVLARCDRADPYQHWRIEKVNCQHLKDKQGSPAFAIVNVATGKAIQHTAVSDGCPVSLYPLNLNDINEGLLWTETKDLGDGFKKIKTRTDDGRVLDVLFDKEWLSKGSQEGMLIGFWCDGSNQSKQWKIKEFFSDL